MTSILDAAWREYPEDRSFLVSSDGRVLKRINLTHPERRQWMEKKFEIDKDGYFRVCLRNKKWHVHRLVYHVFIGHLIDNMVVCHLDGSRQNNLTSNLIQTSQATNIGHKKIHGTWQSRENHPRAKYSNHIVDEIKQLVRALPRTKTGRVKKGMSLDLANRLSVNVNLVYELTSKGAWQ